MLLSLNWLREFVPYEGTAEELGERLTMLGLELEEIRRPCDGIIQRIRRTRQINKTIYTRICKT